MTTSRIQTVSEIEHFPMDTVYMHSATPDEIAFCVTDPILYQSRADVLIVFRRPRFVEGRLKVSNVRLRFRNVEHRDIPNDLRPHGVLYEFVSQEAIPTEGRPIQHKVLADGERRLLQASASHRRSSRGRSPDPGLNLSR
jgi:hypothetical protein